MSGRELNGVQTRPDWHLPGAGVYTIDAAHSSVEFVARHLMITKVRGRFNDFSGQITIAGDPEASHAEVDIAAASVDTGNNQRDAHLRSADFFGVNDYPVIAFRSTGVRALPAGAWEVVGDLTVRDTTRPVPLRVEFEGTNVSPSDEERIGFSAITEVDREDFGLTWNQALEAGGVLVGRNVRIELSVEAVRAD